MTRARRKLAACLAGVVPALFLATAALADAPHMTLNPDQGPPGTTVVARGTGFCTTCGPIEIDFTARPVKRGIVPAADGSFETTFQVPGGAQAGTDAVNAYQQGGLVTQTSFTVTPSAAAPTDSPPTQTGSPTPRQSAAGGATPTSRASPQSTANASSPAPTSTPAGGEGSALGQRGSSSGPPTAAIALSLVAGVLVLATAGALLYRRRLADSHS